jgi:hypothetical protein
MNLSLSDWKDIATIAGVIVALGVFIKGVYEYVKQGSQKRAEQFIELRKRLKDNDEFANILELLEKNSDELRNIPLKEKYEYLGFFEEIALMVNSGLISPEIAHYMFSYYAIRCWKSDLFWSGINRDSLYWIVFRKFVEQMQSIEGDFEYNQKKLRF